jgi:hypothetical protein
VVGLGARGNGDGRVVLKRREARLNAGGMAGLSVMRGRRWGRGAWMKTGGAVPGRRGTTCREEGWRHVGRGGSAPGDRGVARGEGLGGVGTGDWRGGAQMVRGGTWRRVGIGAVAAQGDQRGGVTLSWCGDWLVVALGKRNTKSVG